jgi:hypothetical protein
MIDFRDDAVRNSIRYSVTSDIETLWQTRRGHRRFSTRLSPSNMGEECAAATWFGFRWVTAPDVPEGRMERYNSRGEDNEKGIVEWLRETGWTVEEIDPATGKQWAVSNFHGHMYGKCDGIASHPIYTEGQRILLEFKYINDKRYISLISKPLIVQDLKYYNQVMIYLRELQLPAVMFMPVNRNTEAIDAIILPYDGTQLDMVYAKASTILTTKTPPAKIAQSSAFYKCKVCDHVGVCHDNQPAAKNCRSCHRCMPTYNGEFHCEKWNAIIPKDTIKIGCDQWISII